MLAHFHTLRLVLSQLPISTEAQCMAVLQSLAVSADTLIPGQIMEELNEDRARAGFPEIRTRKEVEIQIRNLLEETAKAFIARIDGIMNPEGRKMLSQRLKEQYQRAASPYHNSYFLELVSDFLNSAA